MAFKYNQLQNEWHCDAQLYDKTFFLSVVMHNSRTHCAQRMQHCPAMTHHVAAKSRSYLMTSSGAKLVLPDTNSGRFSFRFVLLYIHNMLISDFEIFYSFLIIVLRFSSYFCVHYFVLNCIIAYLGI